MTTTTKPTPWWRAASNPECAPWCTAAHDADEFKNGAGFLCSRTITDSRWAKIELQRHQYGENEPVGVIVAEEPTVWLERIADTAAEDLSLEELETFGYELYSAAFRARDILGQYR